MKWSNLKSYKCPKCSGELELAPHKTMHGCKVCGFIISSEKFDKIVAEKYEPHTPQGDNLEALNNLGHDLVTEDFSDSPYADREDLIEETN